MQYVASLDTKTLLLLIVYLSSSVRIYADEDFYYVYDASTNTKLEDFTDYYEANDYYNQNIDEYQNLTLSHNDVVIQMEYGIVEFKTNQGCSLNLNYHSISKNEEDYLNGCLGIDALYLSTDYLNNRVYFLLSGDKAYIDMNDVVLHPYEHLPSSISNYRIIDNKLVHNIKTQLVNDYYSFSIKIDNALSYLKENTNYYSYNKKNKFM